MKPSRFPANRNAKYSGKHTVTIDVDTSSLDALLDELGDEVQAAVRPAAQAGAQVLYDEVRKNVAALGRHTGSLYASIYQKYSLEKSGSAPGRAEYHISWRTSDAALDSNGQPIRTGLATAPHGHLVEFGHIQRYATYLAKNGHWYTAVRPSMRGKPKPRGKGATQAAKDAYFVMRKGGPQQIAAHPFIRSATSKFPQALAAAEAKLLEILNGKK